MTSCHENLLETLKDLSDDDLEKFKHVLLYIKVKEGLPRIPRNRMEVSDRVQIVELIVKTYGQQCVEVTMEVFKKMNRRDLLWRLSDIISSESKGKLWGFGMQRVVCRFLSLLFLNLKYLCQKLFKFVSLF